MTRLGRRVLERLRIEGIPPWPRGEMPERVKLLLAEELEKMADEELAKFTEWGLEVPSRAELVTSLDDGLFFDLNKAGYSYTYRESREILARLGALGPTIERELSDAMKVASYALETGISLEEAERELEVSPEDLEQLSEILKEFLKRREAEHE